MTWEEIAGHDKTRFVPILPIGATEAHGPHLPLSTDVIIAEAMAQWGAKLLHESGYLAVVLPPLAYTSAAFAGGFAGTISLQPETETALIVDIGRGLANHGVQHLICANAHLDPTHIGAIYAAAQTLERETPLRVSFPDITRKPWALRLSAEFKSGACHAGSYEGSIVMAARPDLVRDTIRTALPANFSSLSQAIRAGKRTFEEAGGPRAYFGDPAAASAEEGHATIATLGQILHDAFIEGRLATSER
jgi:creatinine amidohydrolase